MYVLNRLILKPYNNYYILSMFIKYHIFTKTIIQRITIKKRFEVFYTHNWILQSLYPKITNPASKGGNGIEQEQEAFNVRC
jgi:hypothetical protein